MDSKLILITGLPASGKTTLARELEKALKSSFCTLWLDGYELRKIFGHEEMSEMAARKMEEVLPRFLEVLKGKGLLIILSIVASKESFRERLLGLMESVHVHLVCGERIRRQRDAKGVYDKAIEGKIFLPGFSETYEELKDADLFLDTTGLSIDEEVRAVLKLLRERGWI